MSLRKYCTDAALTHLEALSEDALAGLIETFMETYPNKGMGREHPAIISCAYPDSMVLPEGIDRIPERAFVLFLIALFRALDAASDEVKELLGSKIRHHTIYGSLEQLIWTNDIDVSPLERPRLETTESENAANHVWNFGLLNIEQDIVVRKLEGKMPSLTETVNLLERVIAHEYFDDDSEPALDYTYVFGLGWSVKQSQYLLQLLDSVGEIIIDTSANGDERTLPARNFFDVRPVSKGSYITMSYDSSTNTDRVYDISLTSNYGRGHFAVVENYSTDLVYWYRFM
jgi:hypothetical protein